MEGGAGFRLGSGLDADSTHGPLITAKAVRNVQSLVDDAVAKGARIETGGMPGTQGDCFYQPTVLSQVVPGMRVAREEIFGPVAPIFRFETEAQAIAMANDTEFGLAAYVFTRDVGRVWRVSEGLEFGMVGVNEIALGSDATPFGGMKQSGQGREGSRYGMDDYLEIKYICMGGLGQ
jgi:succinate-semialdehyde dehydrogenase/glutarate-semialdehyde dehydrogenase